MRATDLILGVHGLRHLAASLRAFDERTRSSESSWRYSGAEVDFESDDQGSLDVRSKGTDVLELFGAFLRPDPALCRPFERFESLRVLVGESCSRSIKGRRRGLCTWPDVFGETKIRLGNDRLPIGASGSRTFESSSVPRPPQRCPEPTSSQEGDDDDHDGEHGAGDPAGDADPDRIW